MTRLVMVPGAHFRPGDFAAHGIADSLRHRGVEPIEADLPGQAYLDGDVAHRLHALCPPGRFWMLGISLGALGAVLLAQAHPGRVAGLILIAPFLGSRGLVAEVLEAGGLDAWQAGTSGEHDFERRMMAGLKAGLPGNLSLGYGAQDRFAPASHLLARRLPPQRVVALPGGHDWPTWEALWSRLLESTPFTP